MATTKATNVNDQPVDAMVLAPESVRAMQKAGTPAGSRGLTLRNVEEMWRFAQAVVVAGLAPRGLEQPARIFIALELGAELGLRPMQSIQSIAVVNGRPSLWGDAMLALCQGTGELEEHDESFKGDPNTDAWRAVCTVKRRNRKPTTLEFSVAQAKRARLWDKTGTWQTHPDRMLTYRARAFALRKEFADCLCGLHMAEELEGVDGPSETGRIAFGEMATPELPAANATPAAESPAGAPADTATEQPASASGDSPLSDDPKLALGNDKPLPKPKANATDKLLKRKRQQCLDAFAAVPVDMRRGLAFTLVDIQQETLMELLTKWLADMDAVQ